MVTLNMEKFFNSSIHQKIESVQYKTCLAITGARKGVSEEKLYDKLGLEPLQLCRWFRKSCYFYKSCKNEYPQHLFKLANLSHFPYNAENILLFKTKHNFFKNSFFLQLLSSGTVFIWKVGSLSVFKINILKFIRPILNSVFNCENHRKIKLITRVLVVLRHLR